MRPTAANVWARLEKTSRRQAILNALCRKLPAVCRVFRFPIAELAIARKCLAGCLLPPKRRLYLFPTLGESRFLGLALGKSLRGVGLRLVGLGVCQWFAAF